MSNQEVECDPQSRWGGHIQLVYSNDESNEVVVIGGAGFKTRAELDSNWSRIPEHNHAAGEPWCMADYCLPNGDIVSDKQVSQQACAELMGKPFAELVAEGLAWNATGVALHQVMSAAKRSSF